MPIYLLFRQDLTVVALWALAIFVFLYKPYFDSLRLYQLNEISLSEHKRWAIPFSQSYWYPITHFKKLYFNL